MRIIQMPGAPFSCSRSSTSTGRSSRTAASCRSIRIQRGTGTSVGRWDGDTDSASSSPNQCGVLPLFFTSFILLGTALAVGMLAATTAEAHHSFAAEYNADETVNLRGTVRK
jgi:hypothetical protein